MIFYISLGLIIAGLFFMCAMWGSDTTPIPTKIVISILYIVVIVGMAHFCIISEIEEGNLKNDDTGRIEQKRISNERRYCYKTISTYNIHNDNIYRYNKYEGMYG